MNTTLTGACPACDRDYRLTAEGAVRAHGRAGTRCPGSGRAPQRFDGVNPKGTFGFVVA